MSVSYSNLLRHDYQKSTSSVYFRFEQHRSIGKILFLSSVQRRIIYGTKYPRNVFLCTENAKNCLKIPHPNFSIGIQTQNPYIADQSRSARNKIDYATQDFNNALTNDTAENHEEKFKIKLFIASVWRRICDILDRISCRGITLY